MKVDFYLSHDLKLHFCIFIFESKVNYEKFEILKLNNKRYLFFRQLEVSYQTNCFFRFNFLKY